MPDNDRIPIDSLTQIPDYNGADVLPIVHEENGVKTTYKGLLSGAATFINKNLHYSTDLHTQNDTIIGAINEIAEGGGGSADIISEVSGSVVTFEDGGDNIPVKSLVTEITATQEGSGTPAPDNVRAITGVDTVEVVVGVNLWDEQWEVGYISVLDGTNSNSQINIRSKNYIPIKPNVSLYLKANIATVYCPIIFYDKDKNFLFSVAQTLWNRTITTPENAYYMRFYMHDSYGTTYNNDISINYPSTDTAYHHSSTHTIPLPETIYGGSLDVSAGEGKKTWVLFTTTWGAGVGSTDLGTNIRKYYSLPIAPETRHDDILCNVAPYLESYEDDSCHFYISSSNNNLYVYLPEGTSNDTVIQVAYYLATPTAFTFTGANIPTLSGVNNIYSNCGDVEVEYFNSNADQMAELIRVMTR